MNCPKIALALCLASMSSAAPAAERLEFDKGDAGSLNSFPARVLPVLVRVGVDGRVEEVDPAYRLSPDFDRVLQSSIEEMIQGPALDKQGRRVPSQFILNLILETNPRDDGGYDASFRYASTQPVPSGRWGWNHIDGHRLALFDRNSTIPRHANPSRVLDSPGYPSPAPSRIRDNSVPVGASSAVPDSAKPTSRGSG